MKTSEQIGNVAKALAKAQSGMPHAIKDSVNPHLKNKYAGLTSTLDAVRPHLSSAGIALVQAPGMAEGGGIEVETRIVHADSGEWIACTVCVPVQKSDAQGYGSAITYARRYGLQSLCGIASDDDDDDGEASMRKLPPVSAQQKTPAAQSAQPLDYLKQIADAASLGELGALATSIPATARTDALRKAFADAQTRLRGAA